MLGEKEKPTLSKTENPPCKLVAKTNERDHAAALTQVYTLSGQTHVTQTKLFPDEIEFPYVLRNGLKKKRKNQPTNKTTDKSFISLVSFASQIRAIGSDSELWCCLPA